MSRVPVLAIVAVVLVFCIAGSKENGIISVVSQKLQRNRRQVEEIIEMGGFGRPMEEVIIEEPMRGGMGGYGRGGYGRGGYGRGMGGYGMGGPVEEIIEIV
ncbi:unnamed protein product [Soboliphyme baturini]|uniref:DUF148 domain-containing protein n=1 Tax=Soboliphyme baturini TaxID=241478 RepID=A0A183IWA2_9BILA|nr:unnamed protein product [Soboliphyme baturini]